MGEDVGGGPLQKTQADIAAIQIRITDIEQAAARCSEVTAGLTARLEPMLREADGLLQAITTTSSNAAANLAALNEGKMRADSALTAIEEARRKADSESAYAYNAKGNAEDHAKVISQLRGTVEATSSAVTTTKAAIDQIAQQLTVVKAEADAQLRSATDTKATLDRLGAEVRATKERIDAVLPGIEQGSRDAGAISAAKAAAEANAAAISAFQTQMSELVASAESQGGTIAKTEEESKAFLASMRDVQSTASDAHRRVIQYEQQIATLEQTFTAMQEKLEGLLPHATSAGLASAFLKQKERFSKARPMWMTLFVAALGLLIGDALLERSAAPLETWDLILRHLMNRLPVVGPLLWLAIYAAHQYGLALRMEEDYAFKEAVSTAFEGYKREMLAIGKDGGDTKPLVTLCENVLNSLAERPGRIYDGKTDVVTPLTPILTNLKDVLTGLVKKKKDEQPH